MSTLSANRSFSKLDYLKLMVLSREGDRREGILLRQSRGWFQVSGMGHEALGAICWALRSDDYFFPYYRDRAMALARGISNYDLALGFFAKQSSSSAGRQMPSHYSDRRLNVFSACTPTAGNLLPGCGAAWAMKLEGKDSLVVATVGDAATRQGEFYEAIAFASQERLPIVFIVEDNKYGISTPTAKFLPFHLGIMSEQHVVQIDARHPEVVHHAAVEAVERARKGDGPTVLWCDLDRLSSHTSSDDHRVYRKLEDIEAMSLRDPIRLFAEELIENGELNQTEWTAIQDEVARLVDEDYLRAEKEADPDSADLLDELVGEHPVAPNPIRPGRMTMVSAINQTFRQALEADPRVVFFGEDIEDPKGGVFGMTKGLSDAFPRQVFNSPLAEATIMGVAVGMAAYGLKPVFELQFVDFVAPGWNQITTNMSTLRWRTNGEWTCPAVVYAPYGAYLPGGGLWHSQANESMFAHWPGLNVAIPSTPEDAAGLFASALQSEDPCFILVPKHIFRKQLDVSSVEPVPFGKAKVLQEGSDVTLVAWGNTLEVVMEAVDQIQVSAEVIDLRSIAPCDYETIERSLAKTGRLVVVHEDGKTGGFGQTIIAEMTRIPERWNLFLSPPQLVARKDVHIGFNPKLEYTALPAVEDVVQAIRTVME